MSLTTSSRFLVPARCCSFVLGNRLRIALCGYEGEHDMPGWTLEIGKATNGGYGKEGNGNAKRERIWFSPHCLQPDGLFHE
jgi:hypothetical protein